MQVEVTEPEVTAPVGPGMRRSLPALLALLALVLPAVAHADADPASDTLYTGRVFLPLSAKVSPRLARELDAVTLEAERVGRPVRVALIASKTDLGGVPQLFGRTGYYARFLPASSSTSIRTRCWS